MATAKKAPRKRVAKTRKAPAKARVDVAAATATAPAPPAPERPKPAKPAAPAKPALATKATKAADDKKAKKPRRVRGEFAMPEADYARIGKLKATARRVGIKVKKNELLRLGLQALQGLPASELRDAVVALRLPRSVGTR
jgi:hypothetical protein